MGFFNFSENEDDRSHQDNFLYSDIDNEHWDNGSYQLCPFCGKKLAYEWDRCSNCKNS